MIVKDLVRLEVLKPSRSWGTTASEGVGSAGR